MCILYAHCISQKKFNQNLFYKHILTKKAPIMLIASNLYVVKIKKSHLHEILVTHYLSTSCAWLRYQLSILTILTILTTS